MLFTECFSWPSSIPTLDRLAAEKMLRPYKEATLAEAVFLAFLIGASRTESCVEISDCQIKPSPDPTLAPLILEGKECIPETLVIKEGERIYLPKNYHLEKTCLEQWKRLAHSPSLHPFSHTTYLEHLTCEQAEAVKMGCRSQVFILTGGPGTGKTYTAGRLLQNLHTPAKQVALAAPTGKAALTLEKALGGIFKAKTLHALLSVKGDGSFPERLTALPYDLVLVDEASMINTEMMARLLSVIKSGAQLILMGDPHQLPPVEGTPIFPLLVQNHPTKVELTQCLRAETLDLVTFAHAVRHNLPLESNRAVRFTDEPLESLLSAHLSHFPHTPSEPAALLAAFQAFRILTPFRVGPSGSLAVNQWFSKKLRKEGVNAIPIMITANDYRLGLFNGEVGILMAHYPAAEEDYAYFSSGKKLPALLLPPYEPAYALTVHKSQGSEFDHVLLLLPKGIDSGPNSTPLLYTAVTRARKKITLWREY